MPLVPRLALLACLICLAWSYRLIRSSSNPLVPARLIRSPRVSLLALSARLSHRLIGSPLPRIAWLPASSTSRAGRKRDPHRREDIGGGWRTAGGVVAACLPRGDGLGGSSNLSSSHRRGGAFFSFSPDPLPPALLGLLAWACSPVPGRGM